MVWFWWTGTDAHLNLGTLLHPPDASSFDEKTVFGDSSIAGPSVATFNVNDAPGAAFIAWTAWTAPRSSCGTRPMARR